MLRKIVCAALMLAPTAFADTTVPPVLVEGGTDTALYAQCSLTNRSAVAAVEGQLRHSNIIVAHAQSAQPVFIMDVTITPIQLAGANSCAVSYSIAMFEVGTWKSAISGHTHSAEINYCRFGGEMYGPTHDLQERINDALRNNVDECIAEYEKFTR